MDPKIDFVVTWLDSSDPVWQKEYVKYKNEQSKTSDSSAARYRDWNLFRYWFRAVENYAPWVNKVFLVTNGTFPDWINENHPKLVLVKHSDYIPSQYLPTFNSHTIELHMNKIPGLSEHFVYFNDDCFLNAPVTPAYYFREGLPCDCNAENIFNVPIYTKDTGFFTFIVRYTNIAVLNGHFKRNNTLKGNFKRWYGSHLGLKSWVMGRIISFDRHNRFVGFISRHFEQPFLKSVIDEAWEKEPDMLNNSCTRFRENISLNPYFFRYWQFATNKFYPVTLEHARKYVVNHKEYQLIINALRNKNIWSICANDSTWCTDEEFSLLQPQIQEEFERKFPVKSSFEKN